MSEEPKTKLSSRILKAISLFLMIVFFILIIIGYSSSPINFQYILIGFFGLMASSVLRTIAGSGIIEIKYLTITELGCNNSDCNFIKYRTFEKGDYIFKVIGKCAKCFKGINFIRNIFQMEEEKGKLLMAESTKT